MIRPQRLPVLVVDHLEREHGAYAEDDDERHQDEHTPARIVPPLSRARSTSPRGARQGTTRVRQVCDHRIMGRTLAQAAFGDCALQRCIGTSNRTCMRRCAT
jgi:hypothetical protein